MKTLLIPLFTFLLTVCSKPSVALYVDTAYIVTEYYSSDSSILHLICLTEVSSSPCSLESTYISTSLDTVQVILCYFGGALQTTCNRTDSINLGVYKNSTATITAIFKQYFNGQCSNSLFNKDTFQLNVLTPTSTSKVPENTSFSSFILYPNPASQTLSLRLKQPPTGTLHYQIFAADESFLFNTNFNQQLTTQPYFNIDISALPNGLYFLHLQDDKEHTIKKFVKQ